MSDILRSDIDPYAHATLLDPYDTYAKLRDVGPVVRLERYGIWAMARHQDVAAALQDWRTYSSDAGVGFANFHKEPPWRPKSIVLEVDPPYHTKTREVLARVLSPAAVKRLRPHFEAVAEGMVDELVARGAFDGMKDLAAAYPTRVFGDALGLPEAGREHLLAYGAMAFNSFGPRNALYETSQQGTQPVVAWINAMMARGATGPEGFAADIYSAADRGELAQHEAPLVLRALLTGGVDTTVNAIGNALFAFATNPDQWSRLRDDQSLLRSAFDEVLRFESPVQTFYRTTTRAVQVGGAEIPKGEKVYLSLGGANRDPRRWKDADRFDIARKTGGHVGFGYGVHGCVGQVLARLEAELVLAALVRRVKRLDLAGDPIRRLSNAARGFTALPLRVSR